jgi:hypothetical protein
LRAGDDAPIAARNHLWEFVDVVDAWDTLQDTVSADDLGAFASNAELVLSEPDPAAELPAEERQRLASRRRTRVTVANLGEAANSEVAG